KVKRLFDIVASLIGLTLGMPIIALAAIAIKLTSPGPIFYRQTRSGRFGRIITMTKLRTMHVDAEKTGIQWSGKNDPRVHKVGQFLRKYRIDELPQFCRCSPARCPSWDRVRSVRKSSRNLRNRFRFMRNG